MEGPINGELQVSSGGVPATAENTLQLTKAEALDLTGLTEEQKSELRMRHADGVIDLHKKAAEVQIDVVALEKTLDVFNTQTKKATDNGHSATLQHSQTSSVGRTEVIIGNTGKAASGKLSRSATGEEDKTLQVVLVVAIAILLLAIIITGR
ncbi:MAG: hypothetical protein LBR22_09835 [Desulfovibrio sp.]|jgi:hypothetical protein|nr:hypothetical protein [Desulfovibrio sp.]